MSVQVWDPVVRVTHWALAAVIVIDLLNEASANPWHRYFGYAAGALVLARLAWGLIGSEYARLRAMLETASELVAYVTRGRRRAREYVAHNPFGAWMAFTLWALTLFVVITGWLLQLERYWGDELMESMHATASYTLAALIGIHVGGAIFTSVRSGVNLVKSMVTGRKNLAEQ